MYFTDEPTAASLDKDDWVGVLKLARLWNMPQLAFIAVDRITPDLSPKEKITLGRASVHRVSRWIREGYTAIIGDLNKMTLEGLADDLGWETTARVLLALKKASVKAQPSLVNLSTSDVVDEIVEDELGGDDLEPSVEAGSQSTNFEAIPSSLRITVTQELPVPRRAGTASIISFAPDGVYVSRDYIQTPTRVLQDFGYDTGWRVEKHVRLVGDTTGCGRSDIIAFGDAGVYVSRNNGDGTFAPRQLAFKDLCYDTGWRVEKHVRYVVDLRKKGFVDIIGFGDGGVYVALNRGNGTFSAPKIVLPDFGYEAGGWRLDRHVRVLADVTGNGLPDIIGFGESAVYVALNNGDGTFQNGTVAIENFTPGSGGWFVDRHPRIVADLTGDGRVDIVGFFDNGTHVSLNAGNGTFRSPKHLLTDFGRSRGWAVKQHPRFVADVTGDGCGDITGFGGSSFKILRNRGDGSFAADTLVVEDIDQWGGYSSLGCGLWLPVDLTGNGAADIIGFGKKNVSVSYNDGKGGFGPLQRLRECSFGGVDKTVHWITNLYA